MVPHKGEACSKPGLALGKEHLGLGVLAFLVYPLPGLDRTLLRIDTSFARNALVIHAVELLYAVLQAPAFFAGARFGIVQRYARATFLGLGDGKTG